MVNRLKLMTSPWLSRIRSFRWISLSFESLPHNQSLFVCDMEFQRFAIMGVLPISCSNLLFTSKNITLERHRADSFDNQNLASLI